MNTQERAAALARITVILDEIEGLSGLALASKVGELREASRLSHECAISLHDEVEALKAWAERTQRSGT